MVTMFDDEAVRSRSHGLRPEVLAAQAARLGLRQVVGRCTWPTYNAAFGSALDELAEDGIKHVVFGDIVFPEHRQWANDICAPRGMTAVEPLFGCSTRDLFVEWVLRMRNTKPAPNLCNFSIDGQDRIFECGRNAVEPAFQ